MVIALISNTFTPARQEKIKRLHIACGLLSCLFGLHEQQQHSTVEAWCSLRWLSVLSEQLMWLLLRGLLVYRRDGVSMDV